VEVTDGKLNIYFIPQQENPEINGIEIMPPTPVLPVLPVAPATSVPPVAPAPPATATSSPPRPAGTPGKSFAYQQKSIGNLSTTDPFQEDFNQTLPLSADGRVRLDNVNGRVEIVGWDRSDVAVKALKHGKTQASFEATKINVNASPDEIIIHTVEPSGETGFSGIWSWFKNGGNHNAVVDYAIQVPRNARLASISCVNGRIAIDDVSGDISASTVNGELQIYGATGSLKLSTVNGRMVAELVSLGRGQSVALSSVNGQIEATLPAGANAEVSASTLNGGMTSEFPALVVQKEFPVGKKLKGTLGHGGASVKASTVNGSIGIQQGKPVPPASPKPSPNPEAEKAATTAAQAWLALVDAGNYSESWNEAEPYFQKVVTEKSWEISMESFRKPLGNLLSRTVTSAQFITEMPGAPDGKYVVMQFDSSFTDKKSTVETVTFKLDDDGKWKASGYFIK